MVRGVNKVIILGNLGNDPDSHQTQGGLHVTKCSVATTKSWNDDKGQRQEKTEWHRVVFFNRLAEIASQYLKKGMQVYIEGELKTNSWEKDGVTRYTTEIIAREMQMLGGRQDSSNSPYDSGYASESNASSSSSSYQSKEQGKGQSKDQSMSESKGGAKPSGDAKSDGKGEYDDLDQDIPF